MGEARIRVTCPGCGDLELGPRDIDAVVLLGKAATDLIVEAYYIYECKNTEHSSDNSWVTKHMDSEVTRLLEGAGVEVRRLSRPDELDDEVRLEVDNAITEEYVSSFTKHLENSNLDDKYIFLINNNL